MHWLTVFMAVICAATLCVMFFYCHRASVSVLVAQGVLLVAWMLAPNVGIVALAFLFRHRLIASVLVLLAATVVCGYGTYGYCEYWWSNYRAALAGDVITDVVLPIELVGPIFQWIGVLSTALVAFVASLAFGIASSWIRTLRREVPDGGSGETSRG
jgi:hypothetical protein